MLRRKGFQLADEILVATKGELCFDAPLEGDEPELRQPPDLRLCEPLVRKVCEGRAAPELERSAELNSRGGGVARAQVDGCFLDASLEVDRVDPPGVRPQHVARC